MGLPLHHRLLLRHRPGPRLGRTGLLRRQHRPARAGRVLAAVRNRHPPPRQSGLPVRCGHRSPGHLRRPTASQGRSMTAPTVATRLPAVRSTVKPALTPNRPRRWVENDAYAAFIRRILRAYARRVAAGDIEALSLMTGLSADLDAAISEAVTGLRAVGYSWAESGTLPYGP